MSLHLFVIDVEQVYSGLTTEKYLFQVKAQGSELKYAAISQVSFSYAMNLQSNRCKPQADPRWPLKMSSDSRAGLEYWALAEKFTFVLDIMWTVA